MKQTLEFTISIQADRSRVWDALLGPETYQEWTAPFCAGSHYVGSWEQGAKIKFLTPSGAGMTAEIAEHRPGEFVSIRHLGIVVGGVEDTTSDKARAWAPAYENFACADAADGTVVRISVDTIPEYIQFMNDTYPKALAALKAICERPA